MPAEHWYTPVEAPADLSGLLACSWTARPSGTHRLTPDGCCDLLRISTGTFVLCGPEHTAWTFTLPEGVTAVGVRFRPGAAHAVFGIDVSTITDRRVPVATLVGEDGARVAASAVVAAGDGLDGQRAALVGAVRTWARASAAPVERPRRRAARRGRPGRGPIARSLPASGVAPAPTPVVGPPTPAPAVIDLAGGPPPTPPDPTGPVVAMPPEVEVVLGALADSPRASQTELAAAAGMSVRTLRRFALRAFGYGTATLARILRFQRFLAVASTASGPRSLAGFAAQAGYVDQAHLARECRAITGLATQAFLDEYFPTFPDMADPYKTPGPSWATLAP